MTPIGSLRNCDGSNTRLFVVKQNRYNPPVRHLRRALESGRFGKLVMGTSRVRWSRDQRYYDHDPWRGTWRWDGGVFANQTSYHLDLLRLRARLDRFGRAVAKMSVTK